LPRLRRTNAGPNLVVKLDNEDLYASVCEGLGQPGLFRGERTGDVVRKG
jgi:hypothetical protein